MIRRDPIKPSSKLAFAIEGTEPSDCLDQNFLSDFFRVLRVKDHPNRYVVDPGLMAQDQFLN
jgi:hypothetical protein